ncbi:TadE/TadG family type IV pilus assembly protein [Microvirga roseola]|uniref:TadE/TadG family type IV pilus assembly protein n=1 Tax=Microvirga roseola TaxID=2883126 RepID=UPI0038994E9D
MYGRVCKCLTRDEQGATAIEFAFVAPAFLTLMLGLINLSLLSMTIASLHYSVEEGARCVSVRPACSEPNSRYFAPGPAPVYTSANAACGYSLTATVTFDLNVVFYRKAIPLSATACFP